MSYLIQCRHEIKAEGFVKHKWDRRWYQRSTMIETEIFPRSKDVANIATNEESDDDLLDIPIAQLAVGPIVALSGTNEVGGDNVVDIAEEEKSDDDLLDIPTAKYVKQAGYRNLIHTMEETMKPLCDVHSATKDSHDNFLGFLLMLQEYSHTGQLFDREAIISFLETYQSTTKGKKRFFDQVTLPSSQLDNTGGPPRKRLKSKYEIATTKLKKRAVKVKCSFCDQSGHNRQGCTVMKAFGKFLSTKKDIASLLTNMDVWKPKSDKEKSKKRSCIVTEIIPDGVIYLVLEKYGDEGIFATCLKKYGCIMEGWESKLFSAQCLRTWIIQYGENHTFTKLPN